MENSISNSENLEFQFDNFHIDRYQFMLDLFGGYENFTSDEKFTVDILLKNSTENKTEILNKLRNWDTQNKLFIHDVDSLVQIAKIDSIQVIINLIIFVLFVIMLIVYQMTKKFR